MKNVKVTFSDKASVTMTISYLQTDHSVKIIKSRSEVCSRVTEEITWHYRQEEMFQAWTHFVELQAKQLGKGWEVVNTFIYTN